MSYCLISHAVCGPLVLLRFGAAPLIAFTATKEINYGTETDGPVLLLWLLPGAATNKTAFLSSFAFNWINHDKLREFIKWFKI